VLGKSDPAKISTMPDDAKASGKSDAEVYKDLTIARPGIERHFPDGLAEIISGDRTS